LRTKYYAGEAERAVKKPIESAPRASRRSESRDATAERAPPSTSTATGQGARLARHGWDVLTTKRLEKVISLEEADFTEFLNNTSLGAKAKMKLRRAYRNLVDYRAAGNSTTETRTVVRQKFRPDTDWKNVVTTGGSMWAKIKDGKLVTSHEERGGYELKPVFFTAIRSRRNAERDLKRINEVMGTDFNVKEFTLVNSPIGGRF
jgi:hypothetical protein